MDPADEEFVREMAEDAIAPITKAFDEKGQSWIILHPWLAPLISLVPLFGVYAYIALKQNWKVFVFLFFAYDFVPFLFFPLYIPFKLFVAYDAWVMAKRLQAGRTLGHWEWFWNQ